MRALSHMETDYVSRLYAIGPFLCHAHKPLYLHRYDEFFNKVNRLPGSDSKMAAIMEENQLIAKHYKCILIL